MEDKRSILIITHWLFCLKPPTLGKLSATHPYQATSDHDKGYNLPTSKSPEFVAPIFASIEGTRGERKCREEHS